MRWIYISMVVIPSVLGMLTTLLILSIVIGPPTVIVGGRVPPTLIVVSYRVESIGKSRILRINVSNPGDASVYITDIYVNGKSVLKKQIEVVAHTQYKEVSFALPLKIRGSRLNVTILYAPETGSLKSVTLFVELPKQ